MRQEEDKSFPTQIKILLLRCSLLLYHLRNCLSSGCRIHFAAFFLVFLIWLLHRRTNCKINKTILNVFLIEKLSVFSQIKQKKGEQKNEENFAIDFSVFFHFFSFLREARKIFLFSMLEHEVGEKKSKAKAEKKEENL